MLRMPKGGIFQREARWMLILLLLPLLVGVALAVVVPAVAHALR